jgi:hypothetical protein
MASDAPKLIEAAVKGILLEVPALKNLKLVVGIDFHARGDTQQFRLEMPDIKVTKDIASDAKVRLEMRRDFFNLMLEHGAKVQDWRMAFLEGRAKATGVQQYLKLIEKVVDAAQERQRMRKARSTS